MIVLPFALFDLIAFSKASTVSVTYVKSLLEFIFPKFIFLPFRDWLIIVGITALKDCLGPYVLNGLQIVIGNWKE